MKGSGGNLGLENEEEIRGVLCLILPVDWIQKDDDHDDDDDDDGRE